MAKTPTPTPTTDDPTPEDPPTNNAAPDSELSDSKLSETDAPERRSLFRRHPLGTAIIGGAVAVVLVSGLTAWGVGAAVTASLTSSNSAEMPMGATTTAPTTAPGTAPGTGKAKVAGRIAFRATIQSITGDNWTILTKKGKTVTVAVDTTTQFGTKKMTATSGSFAVGDSVIIVATKGATGTPTATRVVAARTGS
jgi:hypothetical protein